MERSEDRLLTTHAGSLPRPQPLVELLAAQAGGAEVDLAEHERLTEAAVAEVVRRQAAVGIDVANDGEQGRESFFTYVRHRMSGFADTDATGDPAGRAPARAWRDMADFPALLEMLRVGRSSSPQVSLRRPPQAVSEVGYGDDEAIEAECRRLARLTADRPFAETFLTAPSPGIVVAAMANRFYPSDAEYLTDVARALAIEYRAIVDAGLVLQIDAPDLAMERHSAFADRPLTDFLGFVESVISAINGSLAGIDPARVRLHVCWGNYAGPHTHDVPLAELLPLLYEAQVGGLLISGANPRHEHEYREFAANPLPDGWTLAAGVIDTTTNYVEHPEVVADRLERIASAIGDPTRILASSDCGFDTAAGFGAVAPDVAWAKLEALRTGADIATERMFR